MVLRLITSRRHPYLPIQNCMYCCRRSSKMNRFQAEVSKCILCNIESLNFISKPHGNWIILRSKISNQLPFFSMPFASIVVHLAFDSSTRWLLWISWLHLKFKLFWIHFYGPWVDRRFNLCFKLSMFTPFVYIRFSSFIFKLPIRPENGFFIFSSNSCSSFRLG